MSDYVLTNNNVRVPAPKPCTHTTVDTRTKVVVNGIEHGGSVAHKCSLKEVEHPEYCQCACGFQFRGIKG